MDDWRQAGRTGDDRARAALLAEEGARAFRDGRIDDAAAHWRAVLPLFRVFGDARGEVSALEGLAQVALARGDSPGALELRSRAVDVARASGRPELVVEARGSRSDSLEREGRLREALGEAQAARREAGPDRLQAATERVARLHLRRGEHEHAGAAIATLQGARDLRAELALRRGEPVAAGTGTPLVHALVEALAGDLAAARRRLADPATPFDEVVLGLLDHAEGRPDAAADRLAFARDTLARTGWRADAALAGLYGAAALADAGRMRVGEGLLADAEDELTGADSVAAEVEVTKAHLLLAQGDRDAAEVLLGTARARPEPAAPTLRLRFDVLQRALLFP